MDEIVLALGGGGARGIAHLGVVRFLEREGLKIKAIAGTSAGGLVGALLAAGYTTFQIENLLAAMENPRLFSRSSLDGPSLLGLQGLIQILSAEIDGITFDQLAIPFACTAVDLATSQEVILAQGPVLDAVLATIAVPGIFPPQKIGNYHLVDGGVMDPVPVALARWLSPALPVIAVCLQSAPDRWAELPDHTSDENHPALPILERNAPHFAWPILEQVSRMRLGQAFHIFVDSMETTSRMLAELRLQQERPDAIIRPEVDRFGLFDLVDPTELIRLGETAARQCLPEIHRALSWSNQLSRIFRRAEPPGKVLLGEFDPNQTL